MLRSDPEKILHDEQSFIKQTCLNFDNPNGQYIKMENAKTVVGKIGWPKTEKTSSYKLQTQCCKKEKLHLEFLSLSQ